MINSFARLHVADQPERAAAEAGKSSWSIERVFRMLTIIFLVFGAPASHASLNCDVTGLGKVITAGVISVPAKAAVGTTVATLPSSALRVNCVLNAVGVTTSTIISTMTTVTAPAAGFNDVYPTNVDGLGIRYTFGADALCSLPSQTMEKQSIAIACLITGPADSKTQIYANMTVTASLVVTGAVKPGASTLSTTPVVSFTFTIKDEAGTWPKGNVYAGSASGTLSSATCSVQTAANEVSLPTVATRALAGGIGATAGRQAFTLSFACATGAQMSIVITDAVNPANRTNVLTLSTDSTAKGIGVQVLRDATTLVFFGPESAAQNTQGQWLIGATPNGIVQLPLSAQYVRTGVVQAGSVKALATFTMSYK